MADETLITPLASATKIRTDNVRVHLTYSYVDAGGSLIDIKPKNLHFAADDPGLTAGQRTTIINFAKAALQAAGLVA